MNDLMGGLDDATLHALLGSVGDNSHLDDLKDQMAYARKLRTTQVDPTIAGSPSHIPSIAGQIGGMLDRYQGRKDEEAARAERQGVYDKQAALNEKFINALLALQHGAAAPVPGQADAPLPGAPSNPMYK